MKNANSERKDNKIGQTKEANFQQSENNPCFLLGIFGSFSIDQIKTQLQRSKNEEML